MKIFLHLIMALFLFSLGILAQAGIQEAGPIDPHFREHSPAHLGEVNSQYVTQEVPNIGADGKRRPLNPPGRNISDKPREDGASDSVNHPSNNVPAQKGQSR